MLCYRDIHPAESVMEFTAVPQGAVLSTVPFVPVLFQGRCLGSVNTTHTHTHTLQPIGDRQKRV